MLKRDCYFGWWKGFPKRWFCDISELRHRYPQFPDLSIDEFAQCLFGHTPWSPRPPQELGVSSFTAKFVHYFSADPTAVWSVSWDDESLRRTLDDHRFDVCLLPQHQLERDLAKYREHYVPPVLLARAMTAIGRVNASRRSPVILSEEIREMVLHRERFITEALQDAEGSSVLLCPT